MKTELDDKTKLLIKQIEGAVRDRNMDQYIIASAELMEHRRALPVGETKLDLERDYAQNTRRRFLGGKSKISQDLVHNYLTMVWPRMKRFDPDASAPMLGYLSIPESDWNALRQAKGFMEGYTYRVLEDQLLALDSSAMGRCSFFDYRPLCHLGQVIIGVTLSFQCIMVESYFLE